MIPSLHDIYQTVSNSQEWSALIKKRKQFLALYAASFIGAVAIFLIGVIMVWLALDPAYASDEEDGMFGVILFGAVICLSSIGFVVFCKNRLSKRYSRHYKHLLVPRLVAHMIERSVEDDEPAINATSPSKCHYSMENYISPEQLTSIPLFKKFDRLIWEGEDLFTGSLGQTDYQFSELKLTEITEDSEGNKSTHVVFRGLVFLADFHKSFEGTVTFVSRKGTGGAQLTMDGRKLGTISHEFDRLFRLSATDEITARYVLPINMIERLLKLRNLFPKKGISGCLHNGVLALAIHNVDFFEVDGLKKPDASGIRRTYEEITSIIQLIQVLNLNLRIWSKQDKDFVV